MNINIVPNGAIKRVHVSQNDVGRTLTFELFNNSTSYTVPSGATVKIQGTKPSGFGFSETCTVSGNTATVDTTEAMTDEYGYIDTELQISYSGNVIGTSNFVLAVEKNPHPDTTTDGSMDTLIPELTLLVNEVKGYAEEIENTYHAYGSPWVASTVAQMTDTDKIYVYTGSETGYTNGNWYYYNGSAWVSGGVYNSVAVNIDDTLTVQGACADAKATGDAIGDIESILNTGRQEVETDWEYGAWSVDSSGYLTPQAGQNRVRCTAKIPAEVGTNIYVTVATGYKYVIGFINESNKRISETGWVTEDRTIAITQPYITIVVANTSNSNIDSISGILSKFTFDFDASYDVIDDMQAEIKKLEDGMTYKSKLTFDNFTTTNADMHVLNGSRHRFSNTSKLIYATSGATTEGKITNFAITNWKSLTFSLYINWEQLQTSSGTRSELTVSFNSLTGRRYAFTGKIHRGWNMVKFNRSDFNQSDDLTTLTAMNFRLIPIGGATTHGFITLDAVFVDLEIKPTIAIMFDQVWQESIDNGAYEYLRTNGIPYTISTKNYADLSQAFKTELSTMKRYGDDFGYYACYGNNNDYVVSGSTFEQACDNLTTALSDAVGVVGIKPVVYSSTRGEDSEIMQESTSHVGFEYICGGTVSNRDIAYFNKNTSTCIPRHASWESQTLSDIKAHIDTLVTYGSFCLLFTHGICADGNSYMTVDNVLTTSSGVELTKFKSVIDYICTLRNSGTLNVCLLRDVKNIAN